MISRLIERAGVVTLPLLCAMLSSSLLVPLATPAWSQKAEPIKAGDVLAGELTAMKSKRTRTVTYQVRTQPRRLPPPDGLCNLETGPETFQIVTSSDAQAKSLKPFLGKSIAIKVMEVSCAQIAGEYSDAIVSKWSVVPH